MSDPKADLHRYLRNARAAVLWKVAGLSSYDARRPLTPTGTNLLGLVQHLSGIEVAYFGDTFGRPMAGTPVFDFDADANADLWVRAEVPVEEVTSSYRRSCAHADAAIEALSLDAVGRVPHWPAERAEVTLHLMLVHVLAETSRHAGHADIARESLDGAAGMVPGNENLPETDWAVHLDVVERAARDATD